MVMGSGLFLIGNDLSAVDLEFILSPEINPDFQVHAFTGVHVPTEYLTKLQRSVLLLGDTANTHLNNLYLLKKIDECLVDAITRVERKEAGNGSKISDRLRSTIVTTTEPSWAPFFPEKKEEFYGIIVPLHFYNFTVPEKPAPERRDFVDFEMHRSMYERVYEEFLKERARSVARRVAP